MTREDLITRVAKLKAHADSAKDLGNLKEAEAFATKVQALLTEHKLEMSEIEFTDYVESEPVEQEWLSGEDYGQGRKSKRTLWVQTLASGIARTNSCKIVVQTGSNSICFIGKKSDREIVTYLFTMLVPELDKISRREQRLAKRDWNEWHEFPRNWRRSWLEGAADGIYNRLKDAEKKAEQQAGLATGNALVRLTSAKQEVEQWMAKQRYRKAGNMGGALNGAAYGKGKAHAKGMNLRRGIDGSGTRQLNS